MTVFLLGAGFGLVLAIFAIRWAFDDEVNAFLVRTRVRFLFRRLDQGRFEQLVEHLTDTERDDLLAVAHACRERTRAERCVEEARKG